MSVATLEAGAAAVQPPTSSGRLLSGLTSSGSCALDRHREVWGTLPQPSSLALIAAVEQAGDRKSVV